MHVITARKFHGKKLAKAHRLGGEGKYQEAERLYRQYLAICPDDPQVNFNVGVLVQRRATDGTGYFEAAEFYEKAVCSPILDPEIKAAAMNNLGLMATKAGSVEKALGCFMRAVLIHPQCAAAVNNYGDALRHLGRYDEASAAYQEALRLKPDSAEARFAAGMMAIMLGDYARGWADYEWRFQVPTFPTKPLKIAVPMWDGAADLNGKTILAEQEQGFGDSFWMIRYARELKRRWPSCRVVHYCHTLCLELLAAADGVDATFDALDEQSGAMSNSKTGETSEPPDFHCPLLSLPARLGITRETVPAEVPYIRCRDDWPKIRVLTPLSGAKRKVGLVWAGSPRHGKDQWRSIQPEAFQCLIDAHPEIQFYSLQVGPRQHEVSRLRGIVDFAQVICEAGNWAATAVAIEQLDAVVTVDTAVAHLCGAMGKSVHILIPFSPDFRWGLSGETTPWYPTATLHRQPSEKDWVSVIERISKDL